MEVLHLKFDWLPPSLPSIVIISWHVQALLSRKKEKEGPKKTELRLWCKEHSFIKFKVYPTTDLDVFLSISIFLRSQNQRAGEVTEKSSSQSVGFRWNCTQTRLRKKIDLLSGEVPISNHNFQLPYHQISKPHPFLGSFWIQLSLFCFVLALVTFA